MLIAANEGWQALFEYGHTTLGRQVASWFYDVNRTELFGFVADDEGNMVLAHTLERFICYCSPDDDPEEIIRRRAASE